MNIQDELRQVFCSDDTYAQSAFQDLFAICR